LLKHLDISVEDVLDLSYFISTNDEEILDPDWTEEHGSTLAEYSRRLSVVIQELWNELGSWNDDLKLNILDLSIQHHPLLECRTEYVNTLF